MEKTIKPFPRRISLLLIFLIFLSAFSFASTPEILILFDQSRSMRNFNTKKLSILWMSTVARSFKEKFRMTLVGFDYKPHEYLREVIGEEEELSALSEILNGIKLNGRATDIEVPLLYSLDKGKAGLLKMILIITDGEPDVWARQTGFVSPRVLADPRYEDLNKQFRSLKSSGLSMLKLYDRLGLKYRKRNLKFIEQALSLLKGKTGKKMVIWDISGDSKTLKRWSGLSDSIYMPLDKSPKGPLSKALQGLLKSTLITAKIMLKKPILKEPSKQTPAKNEFPSSKSDPDEKIQKAVKQLRSSTPWWVVFFAVILTFGMILYWKYKQGFSSDKTGNDELDKPFDESEISDYIDQRLKTASDFTENYVIDLLKEIKVGKDSGRLSLRVPTPTGSLIVHWTDRDRKACSANAINISMHGILIKASQCDTDGVDYIDMPGLKKRIGVARAQIKRRDANTFVIKLDEFDKGVEDQMTWTEILSRINGED